MQVISFNDTNWVCIKDGNRFARINGINIWGCIDTMINDYEKTSIDKINWEIHDHFDAEFKVICEFNNITDVRQHFAEYFI